MSYIVLARKYRPQTFKEIYSQDHITQILSNAIKTNRIAHAYLFTGPRGVGKTSMARILAKSLNCLEGPTDVPCGVCHNCIEITASSSTDVIEIDGASNTGVDDVRDLQKELFYAPSLSKFKIYIIDEVHMLSKSAFNALLKTLEEPPDNVVFIFATTEPQKVLPTIISRCQRFDFRRIPVDDITARLHEISQLEQIDIDEESLYLIARKSDGGLRDALSLLDQVLSFADGPIRINLVRDIFSELPVTTHAKIMLAICNHDTANLIQIYQELINEGLDLTEFINSFLEFLRNLIMYKIKVPLKGLVKEDMEIISNVSDVSELNTFMYMMALLIQLKQDIRVSSHPSILIEMVLVKMTRLDEMESLESIISRLEKIPAGTKSIPQSYEKPDTSEPVKKVEPLVIKTEETIELDYIPPKKVKELTLEHVLANWGSFIKKIKPIKTVSAAYLKKENITSVKSDIIFMDCDSSVQYKMLSADKDAFNELLSNFFDLPVKLILKLVEPAQKIVKQNPTLQDIQETNPSLAKLIEMTGSLIIQE